VRALLVAVVLVISSNFAVAQDPGAIEVDRPDVSNSTSTVGPGVFQLETGVEYARTRAAAAADERRLALQMTVRAGLTDRLEVRLEGEPLVALRGEDSDTGLGDLTVALKYRVLDAIDGAPALGILPFVTLPVADAPIGSERPDFGVVFLADFALPWELALGVNAALVGLGQSRPRGFLFQGLVSAALSREVVKSLSAFVELFYASPEEREGRHMVGADAGVVWTVSRDVAVDAAIATSLKGPAPDYALRTGVSVRFGR
jgi:outer membrane putative beta-barrel porin/alpha-amylase